MLLVLALLLLTADAALTQRVISGQAVTGSSYPRVTWQVALEIRVGNSVSLCGGSIIAPDYVVTAAHCVKQLSNNALQNPSNMILIAGRDRNNQNNARNVLRYWVEPSYDQQVSQPNRIDLAIIQTINEFDFSGSSASESFASIIPRCDDSTVPQGQSCFGAGTNVFVSGYGQQISGQSSSTAVNLQWAGLLAVAQAQCAAKFNSNFQCTNCLPLTNICAESDANIDPAKDSCFGDSGGPLVKNVGTTQNPDFRLVGVVSSGTVPAGQSPACGKPGEYGVYVSIMGNKAWMDRVLNGQENNTAVDNSCVQTDTCSTFVPPDNPWFFFPPFDWQWYYILAIAIGGVLLVVLVVLICCCCCKR